jgi:hypothetical protein
VQGISFDIPFGKFQILDDMGIADLPPIKCLPLKYLTNGFGAVKLTSTSGMKFAPTPVEGGPDSMFQDEGASTDVTGNFVSSRALITAGKGSRTSPENENPGFISWS